MPAAPVNGIEIFYDVVGDDDGVPLLLIMGLGVQLIGWDDGFCQALADRGFRVVRFDNRDVGLSTKIEAQGHDGIASLLRAFSGEPVEAPYVLSDMAADAVGLLDHLGIDAAHVVGASMGGMIAQTVAIEHPSRVRSLTSIMSTTGDREVGQPTPEALAVLMTPRPTNRDEAVANSVAAARVIGSPEHFEEDRARDLAARAYDRCFHPAGFVRQLLAILASPDRTPLLAELDVPALVIHGDCDPLVTPSGGEATAKAIPGAELVVLEGMGHDLPPAFWPQIVEAITSLAARTTPSH